MWYAVRSCLAGQLALLPSFVLSCRAETRIRRELVFVGLPGGRGCVRGCAYRCIAAADGCLIPR